MAARATIALSLAALAWVGSARAEDDPSCAQYREPMAYNLCLARHGPKANNVGTHSRQSQPGPVSARAGLMAARRPRGSMACKAHTACMGVCTWSFPSSERRLRVASAAPEPAEIAQAPRSSPRAVGDQRGGRASRPAPRRGGAGL